MFFSLVSAKLPFCHGETVSATHDIDDDIDLPFNIISRLESSPQHRNRYRNLTCLPRTMGDITLAFKSRYYE